MSRGRGGFPPAPNIRRTWFLSTERSEAFIGGPTHQSLESQANRIRVAAGSTDRSRLLQEAFINVECLFHAIRVCH